MVKKMMKYGAVGVLGTLLHVGVLVLLVEWLGMNPIISSAIGFLLVLIVSYILNLLWTFGKTREDGRLSSNTRSSRRSVCL